MSRHALASAACAAALILTACGGGSGSDPTKAAAGAPVVGGEGRIMQIAEPRGLAPVALGNAWSSNAVVGNAIYGTLMVNDTETGAIEFKMAKDFSSTDGGNTFTLKLRPDLVFSDGTPFDATAVQVNWEQHVDPALGSQSMQDASLIDSTVVVDDTTLEVTLRMAVPNFGQAVLSSGLNWIASPTALEQADYDAAPVGAGPFTVEEWRRQDAIELVRNDEYWDDPKPYLDSITLRTSNDTNQRYNSLTSGGVDLIVETNWGTVSKAEEAGLETDTVPLNGGLYLAMNTTATPFDDLRARQAVAKAVDLEAIDSAAYQGEGRIPDTLFEETSPHYSDTALRSHDPDGAQSLFDEIAADGDPVSFTFKTFPTVENRAVAESLQAQLSAFDNVDVEVQTIDFAEVGAVFAARDFEMIVSAASFMDPEPRLWSAFHSTSRSNASGIDDAELDAALDLGRTAETVEERTAAYQTVQDRLVETVPVIFYGRAAPSAIASASTYGLVQYGLGSLLPEELWLQ